MTRTVFKTIGYIFAVAAAYAIWLDLRASNLPSMALGQFWFEHGAGSLQVTEAVISRYIDPCGLIVGLGCEPFLWHPIISSALGWPAALCFIVLALIFFGISRLFRGRAVRRVSGQALKRSGSK